jgi:glycosyltransferase involved in cell wall biosynthesis
MEWIILDDGTDKVKDLFDAAGLPNVRYVALPDGERLPIGAKRNRMNDLATGDIVVAWDDDDYYPPERISKSVTALRSAPGQRVPVVGSSELYLYFTDRDEIWSIGPYGQNHCTNGTMAYWRSYVETHRYDDAAEKAEERKFLDDFKTPVIQLRPEQTMLVLCHAYNTFDKRTLLKQGNPLLKKVPMKMRTLVKDKVLRDFYMDLARDYKEKDAVAAATPQGQQEVQAQAQREISTQPVAPMHSVPPPQHPPSAATQPPVPPQ